MEEVKNLKVDPVTLNQAQTEPKWTSDTRADKLVGTILDGKIQIESLIGKGGMSVVYKGTHLGLNQTVAVKVILPGPCFDDIAVLRLQREAKAAYCLSHKNLASVHDVSVTSEGLPYLVMEFAGGETLADMLERGPLETMKAIEVFSQICAGLSAAHHQGIIHRDIKPGNIMVEHLPDGIELVKIVDFGIAKKITENVEEIKKLTQTGEVFGTPRYMSPEQCVWGKLDQRSDIYSLGCVLYEALSGAPPFEGETQIATILMHMNTDAPTPSKELHLPPPLISVLHRCMEKEASDRYQSMDDLYKDLQTIKSGGTTAKKYVKKRPTGKRNKVFIGLVMLGLLGVSMLYAYGEIMNRINGDEIGYTTIEACSDKLAKNHDDFKGHLQRGRLYNGAGNFAKALADLNEAISLNDSSAAAYFSRAMAYQGLGQYDKSLVDCNTSLALDPGNWKALHNRSIAYRHLNDSVRALADANASLKLHPGYVSELESRASLLSSMGRYKESIEDFTAAIKVNGQRPWAYTDRATAYNCLHESQKAIADASEAIRQNQDPSAYAARAIALSQLHQFDKALIDIDTAIQLQPGLPEKVKTRTLKAQILADMGRLDEALALCNQSVLSSAKNTAALQTRANIYKRLGKPDLAQKDLEKVQAIESTSLPRPAAGKAN